MRAISSIGLVLAAAGLAMLEAAPARADHRPVIVIPGHPEAPVIIDGRDASGAYVSGEWGLSAPGRVAPTILPGPPAIDGPPPYGYYPSTGRRPRYGRQEVEPPPHRRLPPPAQSFYREWSTESGPAPATLPPPYDPPPVIVAPRIQR